MNSEIKVFYQHFQDNKVDTQRAAVFDEIMVDDFYPEELKAKLQSWKTAYGTKNVGETMAKSFAISFLRFVMMSDQEREQARRMGEMHRALMPTSMR